MLVNLLVEGPLDVAVGRVLLRHTRNEVGNIYGQEGRGYIEAKIEGFNKFAEHAPILAIVDLDSDSCAPDLISKVLPSPSSGMIFRVAVRTIESWLLADRSAIARFLSISPAIIPPQPEALPRPKDKLLSLARRSRKHRSLVQLGASVGPRYTTEMISYIESFWSIERAKDNSDSLKRCLRNLQAI